MTKPKFTPYKAAKEYTFGQLKGQAPSTSGQHLKWFENTTKNIAEMLFRNPKHALIFKQSSARIRASSRNPVEEVFEDWLPPTHAVVTRKYIVGEIRSFGSLHLRI